MDILSVLGLVMGLFAVVGGAIAKGAGVGGLINPAAFIIVIIGTFAAAFVHNKPAVFFRAFKMLPWAYMPPKIDAKATIEKIVGWSQVARKEGLLGLETISEQEPDEFAKKGLQLLVDGTEPEVIRSILEVDVSVKEHFDNQAAKVFESLGVYAPTLGIIGAVMGLMAVMQNLADPSKLGSGIAAAFVATIYGIGSANLFFLPVSNKLKNTVHAMTAYREMIIEGIISIAEGENPRIIETKLQGYLH